MITVFHMWISAYRPRIRRKLLVSVLSFASGLSLMVSSSLAWAGSRDLYTCVSATVSTQRMPDSSGSGAGARGLVRLQLFTSILYTLLLFRDAAAIHAGVAEFLHIFEHIFLCFIACHVKEHQNLWYLSAMSWTVNCSCFTSNCAEPLQKHRGRMHIRLSFVRQNCKATLRSSSRLQLAARCSEAMVGQGLLQRQLNLCAAEMRYIPRNRIFISILSSCILLPI